MRKFHSKGFTLIELLIVVSIIGLLAAIAIPTFGKYMYQARITDATRYLFDASRDQDRSLFEKGAYAERLKSANSEIPTVITRYSNPKFNLIVGGHDVAITDPSNFADLPEYAQAQLTRSAEGGNERSFGAYSINGQQKFAIAVQALSTIHSDMLLVMAADEKKHLYLICDDYNYRTNTEGLQALNTYGTFPWGDIQPSCAPYNEGEGEGNLAPP